MSKTVIAILENEKWEFFDIERNKIELQDIEDVLNIYAILPDEYYFLFQTDIASKRRANITIKAFARSNFNIEERDFFIGYYRDNIPLIGYAVKKQCIEKENITNILTKANITTTPFISYLYLNKNSSFCYKSKKIIAKYSNGILKRYAISDDECLEEEIKYIEETKEKTIYNIVQIIKNGSIHKINIPASDVNQSGFENWKISRFILIFLALVIFIAGNFIQYKAASKKLYIQQQRLNELYKMALGNKHYTDPFGVLLYEASTKSSSNSLNPLKLLYALSKADKKFKIRIDYINYNDNGLKITGTSDNYKYLLDYVNNLNKLLNTTFSIQNTTYLKGKLNFTIYKGYQNEQF